MAHTLQVYTSVHQDRAVVDQLIQRHGWSLLTRDELLQRMEARLQAGLMLDTTRAATWVYGAALHAACAGAEGDARREQGYRDLHRWLYRIAYQRYRDIAEDATQQALELTHARFIRCRKPGMFLMFALAQLCDTARHLRIQSSVETLVN